MTAELEVRGVPAPVARHIRSLMAGDVLTTDAVLADAERPESPLHDLFEWDDDEAAVKYRQLQARQLISRVKVQVITSEEAEPVNVRAYVSRRDIGQAGENLPSGGYVPIEVVAGGTSTEIAFRKAMKRDVAKLKRKYRGFETFLLEVFNDDDDGMDALTGN